MFIYHTGRRLEAILQTFLSNSRSQHTATTLDTRRAGGLNFTTKTFLCLIYSCCLIRLSMLRLMTMVASKTRLSMLKTLPSGKNSSVVCHQQGSFQSNRAGTVDNKITGIKDGTRTINLNHQQVVWERNQAIKRTNQINNPCQETNANNTPVDHGGQIKLEYNSTTLTRFLDLRLEHLRLK